MRITLAIALLAIATQAYAQFIPPEELDRPFDGRVVIQEAKDQVRRLCPAMAHFTVALGCSYIISGMNLYAIVKLPDDQIRVAGHDPEVFMRHEIGHCNSWPAHHPGAR
jgi:hypothetical protein